MSLRVKVEEGNRIVVPPEMVERAGVHPGDVVVVDVRDGVISLWPVPKDWVEATAGLGSEVWRGVDAQEYVRRERGGAPS